MIASTFVPKTLKLTYFDVRARAEVARLALAVAEIPFEDERLQREQWKAVKPTLPFGQVPVLTVDGTVQIAQSAAICRFVGALGGLYPATDALKAARVDQIYFHVEDMFTAVYNSMYIQDQDAKMAMRKKLAEERLPAMLKDLDRNINALGGAWAVGDDISIADLEIYCFVAAAKAGNWDGIPANITDAFPSTTKIYEAVARHEKIAAWEQAHRK